MNKSLVQLNKNCVEIGLKRLATLGQNQTAKSQTLTTFLLSLEKRRQIMERGRHRYSAARQSLTRFSQTCTPPQETLTKVRLRITLSGEDLTQVRQDHPLRRQSVHNDCHVFR